MRDWLTRGWTTDGRAKEFAEQHPAEVEAVRVARLAVDGVEAYRRAEREAWQEQAAANTPS